MSLSDTRKFRAPGRVNLIGEHTDYNEGLVLPVAVDLGCEVRAREGDDDCLHARSINLKARFSISIESIGLARRRGDWSDYVIGVAREVERLGVELPPLELDIRGDIPLGAGLSSSAALEVATALAITRMAGVEPSGEELARLCLRAESEFVGTRCGIMDQFAAVFGRRGSAVLIDCRSLEHRYVPLPADVALVIVDSGVKHALASGEYNRRRADCEEAAGILDRALREIDVAELPEVEPKLPKELRGRVRHVVSENERVRRFAAAAEQANVPLLGGLMRQSHESLARDYEVSCEELDFLAAAAWETEGVIGARMTGGGFGGCTVNLVLDPFADAFEASISRAYEERFGTAPRVFRCESADGASETTAKSPQRVA